MPSAIPFKLSISEGLGVGMDAGSPVDFNYKLPFKFTGTIDKVTIATGLRDCGRRSRGDEDDGTKVQYDAAIRPC